MLSPRHVESITEYHSEGIELGVDWSGGTFHLLSQLGDSVACQRWRQCPLTCRLFQLADYAASVRQVKEAISVRCGGKRPVGAAVGHMRGTANPAAAKSEVDSALLS